MEYLGHPVNAFNLIKHAAIGWRPFHYDLNSKLNETFNGLKYVLEREANTTIPDHEEIHGAAFGLARLHVQYDLNTELLTKEGVIETKLNMKNVKTPPSAIKLSSKIKRLFKMNLF